MIITFDKVWLAKIEAERKFTLKKKARRFESAIVFIIVRNRAIYGAKLAASHRTKKENNCAHLLDERKVQLVCAVVVLHPAKGLCVKIK
jgi:hypothetical protein